VTLGAKLFSSSSSSSSDSTSRESSPVRRTLAIDNDIRFEGTDPNWAFKPPVGSVPLEHGQADTGEFDWDNVHDNDDLEIVLIRVPTTFKAKHLKDVEIRMNSEGDIASGEVEHKKQTYKLSSTNSVPTGELSVNGQDMKGLKILFPRRTAGGQLYIATKQIGSYLSLSGVSPQTPPQAEVLQNPERPRYPLQMLSHSYMPFGVKRGPRTENMSMAVDLMESMERKEVKSKNGESTVKDGERVKEKSKKRKKVSAVEDNRAPKKSKRVEQNA